MTYDLIITGAGAAGLFAAANVPGNMKTLVLEKTNKPGQKLLLTGSGQCNLTNNIPIREFLNHYGNNGKQLRPVLFPFSNSALIKYFENNSLSLITREDGKVFPASMKSADVLNLLLDKCNKNNVEILYNAPVKQVISNDSENYGYTVKTPAKEYTSKYILITTGGASYPQTGSDGNFFTVLEDFGIKLKPHRPALAPIYVRNYPYADLSGITVPNSELTIKQKEQGKAFKITDSLLFTHKGFSGPAVLTLSRYATPGDELIINFMPGRKNTDLRTELIEASKGYSGQINTLLSSVTGLPRSLTDRICSEINISKEEKASRLSGREMASAADIITTGSFEITEIGGFSTAMITSGGVCLDEVNLKTMEAKHHPGLYFAGEVLDVDGDTGGYNLQFAFSSAMSTINAIQRQTGVAVSTLRQT